MPDDMSPQPTTVSFPAMTDRALLEDLAREVRATRGEVTNARADMSLISNDLGILKQRVSIIEGLRNEDALRAAKNSGGVKQLSESDVGQNMQIASLAIKLDALADQHGKLAESQTVQTKMLVDAANQLKLFVATPAVKVIGGVLFGIFSTWFASHFGVTLPK